MIIYNEVYYNLSGYTVFTNSVVYRSLWPCGLRRGLLSLACWNCRFESHSGAWMWLCCHAEVSATGRSLVQRAPAECGMSECDLETSTTNRLWPTGTAKPLQKPYLILNICKKLHFHYKNSTFHHARGISHDTYNFEDGSENIRQVETCRNNVIL